MSKGDVHTLPHKGGWASKIEGSSRVASTALKKSFESDLARIRLLSIGTTSQPLRVGSHDHAVRMRIRQWMFKALHLLQESSSMATDNQVRLLLGEAAYLRLDSERARSVKLDDGAVPSAPRVGPRRGMQKHLGYWAPA
jgi:hypothetical protein